MDLQVKPALNPLLITGRLDLITNPRLNCTCVSFLFANAFDSQQTYHFPVLPSLYTVCCSKAPATAVVGNTAPRLMKVNQGPGKSLKLPTTPRHNIPRFQSSNAVLNLAKAVSLAGGLSTRDVLTENLLPRNTIKHSLNVLLSTAVFLLQ